MTRIEPDSSFRKKVSVLLEFLEFQEAFDNVNHNILINCMSMEYVA